MKSDVKKFISGGGTKRFVKSTISIVLSLLMLVGLFAALPLNVGAIIKPGGGIDDGGEVTPKDITVTVRFYDKDTGELITIPRGLTNCTLTAIHTHTSNGNIGYWSKDFGTMIGANNDGCRVLEFNPPISTYSLRFCGKNIISSGDSYKNVVENTNTNYDFYCKTYDCVSFRCSDKPYSPQELRDLPRNLGGTDFETDSVSVTSKTQTIVVDFEVPKAYTVKFHTNDLNSNEDTIYTRAQIGKGEKIGPITAAEYINLDEQGRNRALMNGNTTYCYSLLNPNHIKFATTYSDTYIDEPYKYMRPDIGNDYIFKGWFYDEDNDNDSNPVDFQNDIVTGPTDIYAHWDPVEEIVKDSKDDNINANYSTHKLAGVQMRKENVDENSGDNKSSGLRFVASVSNDMLEYFDSLSDKTITADDGSVNNIEYGFVVTKSSNITNWLNFAGEHISNYELGYNGTNVNGVDTTIANTSDYQGFVTNVDCTASDYSTRNIKDHKKFDDYRLYTMVVNYDNNESDKNVDICARAYIRYYDANGLMRVYYNDYDGTNFYGGCSTNYNAVANMA